MTDDKPKKTATFTELVRLKLVDEFLAASETHKDAQGNVDPEALRKKQLEILGRFDQQTAGVEKIFNQLAIDGGAVEKFVAGGARPLRELLVSTEPVSFDSLSDLDTKFGPLPKGFSYRYLAPPTQAAPETEVNKADNVIRLPSSFNFVLDEQFDLSGDEIPERSLAEWLENQPAALYRLWTLRILFMIGILSSEDIPAAWDSPKATATSSSVPSAGKPRSPQLRANSGEVPPAFKEDVDDFRECSVFQYDGETKNIDSYARYGVLDKFPVYARLKKSGTDAVMALATLLGDEDVGVRVSAATYLLPIAPGLALPVLNGAVADSVENDDERIQCAANHALKALWMYEDGNLGL